MKNYFSLFRKAKALKKTVSMVAMLSLVAGGISGIVYTSTAYANNGIAVSAVPNSGTLVPGQNLEVHMNISLDSNDTNPVVADSCLVNGVEVKDTFQNLTSGTDGHFKVTYTVGSGDASRVAGQVPINCTLHQTHSVTVTAFDDNNTVAIDTADHTNDTGSTTPPTGSQGTTTPSILSGGSASQNGSLTASAVPSSGTLHTGDSLQVMFGDPTGTTDAVADSCLVNGVETKGTFQNVSAGVYKVTYTVGSGDQSRTAGNVPIDCRLHQAVAVHVVTFTDSNTVAIDPSTGGSTGGTGTTTPPATAFQAGFVPGSGTFHAGQTLEFHFNDPSQTNLVPFGSCLVNTVNVTDTFQNQTDGQYRFDYTIGANDAERLAGQVPVNCSFKDPSGHIITVNSFTDGNTVAIDTDQSGSVVAPVGADSPFIAGVFANPVTGTLHAGDTLEVYLQEGTGEDNFTPTSCTVNGVNVANSFANLTSGYYMFTYTPALGQADRVAGQVPVDCTLSRSGGPSLHATGFTDENQVAVDVNNGGSTGGTGTTTPPAGGTGTTTSPVSITAVWAVPVTGALTADQRLEVHFHAANNESDLVLSGACTVNGKDVSNSFANVTDGQYIVTYTVASGDTNRTPGQVPVSCTFRNPSNETATVSAFTDNNTVSIDASLGSTGGNTGTTTPDGNTGSNNNATSSVSIYWASITPNAGVLNQGGLIQAYFQETGLRTDLSLNGACTINGVNVPLEALSSGLYRLSYTIGANDVDRAAGQVPISCSLKGSDGGTAMITSWSDNNTLAIDVNGNGSFTDVGTGGTTGGNNTGTTTPDTGNNGGNGTTTPQGHGVLAVDSINQTRGTAIAGAGFESGWAWTFHVTVPDNEPVLSMKFGDWARSNGSTTIALAGNMRISSEQASSASSTILTSAGVYSDPITITGDLDPSLPGKQVDIKVEMKIPADAMEGSYGTYYGIQTTSQE